MKDWVTRYLLENYPRSEYISPESFQEEIQVPEFALRRLASLFQIITLRFYNRERVSSLIGYALGNVPIDIFLMLKGLNTTFLVFDTFGAVTHIREPGVLIALNKILTLRDNEIVGVLSHEIAHVATGELFGSLNDTDDSEKRADDLASQWGFKEEIDALRAYFDKKGGTQWKSRKHYLRSCVS